METCSFFTLADLLSRHPFFFCFLVYCLLAELFFFWFVWNPRRVTFLGCSLAEVRPVRRHVSLWWLYLLADRVTLCKKKKKQNQKGVRGGTGPGGRVAGTRGYFDFSGGGDGRDIPVSGSMK